MMFRTLVAPLASLMAAALVANGPAKFSFSLNKGQWPQQVMYRSLTGQGALFVERDALTYVVRSGDRHAHGKEVHAEEEIREHAYRVQFIGGLAGSHIGSDAQRHYENYFISSDRSRWASNVPVYGGVLLNNIYPGIDVQLHGGNALKYDLLVDAGADPSMIALRYDGIDGLSLRDGRLVVTTSAGDVIEEAPIAWQTINGQRHAITCRYALQDRTLRFEMPEGYDGRFPLVIDPTLTFSSFTGSTADNWGFTATNDATGHLYAGGIVFGTGYPVTLGAQQLNFAGNSIDVGLTKFSPDGTQLIWSTYLGGAFGNESPHSLIVNSQDELYVMGITGSSDFPTTAGCFDNSFGAGPSINFIVNQGYFHTEGCDIFVARLNAAGSALMGSTYVGGSQADGLNNSFATAYNYGDSFRGEIVLDSQERPVVASCTTSPDIPTTPGAAFTSFQGGDQDGYVFAMDAGLTTQLWSTFYGGSGTDACYGLQLSASDEAYVTGGTNSADLDLAGSPLLGSAQGGVDGFIARFSASGTALLSATYIGTNSYDQSYFVQHDNNGDVFLIGQTHGNYPVTPGKYANPGSTQFIQKLDPALSTSIWSTVIGSGQGSEDISPSAFLVSDCGQIFFSGWGGTVNQIQQAFLSTTTGLPVTPNALQSSTDGSDFYLMVLDQEAVGLFYATFFGGALSAEHVDGGTARFSKAGVVYQAVCAGCGAQSDMPTTPGAWSNTNNSFNCNLGVFKIDFEVAVSATFTASPFFGCVGDTIQFISTGTATSWLWDFGDGSANSTVDDPTHVFTAPGTYPVTLIASDSTACNYSDTLVLDVVVQAPATLTPTFTVQTAPCGEGWVTVANTTQGQGYVLQWDMGDGNTYTAPTFTHTYASLGTYTISLTVTDTLCGGTASAQQEVILTEPPPVEALFTVTSGGPCTGLSFVGVDASTGPAGLQIAWDMGDGTQLSGDSVEYVYSEPGSYTITLTAFDPLCNESDTYTEQVEVEALSGEPGEFIIPNVFSPNGDGKNDTFFPIPLASTGQVELRIYNRWGMKIYETGVSYVPWNGKARSSKEVSDGVYYYILNYSIPCDGDVNTGEQKGAVQLLR